MDVATPSAGYSMLTIPEALDVVLNNTPVLDRKMVASNEALGMVLAEDVIAGAPHPPFAASIMDGYAVVSSDGVCDVELVGESRAGSVDAVRVSSGKAAYITTGAPVPEGADAVIMIENTARKQRDDGRVMVTLSKAVKSGENIRAVGCDISKGATVLSSGERIGIAEIGLLATIGVCDVAVHARPLVAVVSSGDEVVEPSLPHLAPGQIRDANRAMLMAAAKQAGAADVIDLGIAKDVVGNLETCLQRALNANVDILVSSGGVSMGDRDLIKPLLEKHGRVHFGKVCMKPGKPLTFATLQTRADGKRMLVFALPGNPVSSFACFNLVVRPAMRKMMGWRNANTRRIAVRTTTDLKLDPERPEYHRAAVHFQSGSDGIGELVAVSTGAQASHRLLSARSANVLLELPKAEGSVTAGSVVSALLVDDLQAMHMD